MLWGWIISPTAVYEAVAYIFTRQNESWFKHIIVIGDWNDQSQDEDIYQSFRPFINDKNHFRFVTDLIVDDPNQQSYPTWPSFLIIILIGESFLKHLIQWSNTIR
jgi:hypothetical protein